MYYKINIQEGRALIIWAHDIETQWWEFKLVSRRIVITHFVQNKGMHIDVYLSFTYNYTLHSRGEGGTLHMKGVGMLVRNFELNP